MYHARRVVVGGCRSHNLMLLLYDEEETLQELVSSFFKFWGAFGKKKKS